MKSSRSFFLFALIVLLTAALPVGASPKWKTVSTPHFTFYFNQATEESARRLAGYAEAIHDRVTSELGIQPKQKTHVVVTDFTDEINGMASVVPRPYIILYENADSAGGPFGIGDSQLATFYHEYTHILQIGHVTGLPEAIRRITGLSIILPNAFLPVWSSEGLATFEESLFSPIGRLHNSTWRMFLRAEYLENRMSTWDQVWAGPYRWPYGNLYYLYGSYFTDYLARRFGADSLGRFYNETADDLPFIQFKSSFRKVFGHSFRGVLEEWYAEIGGELAAESTAIRDLGLAEGTPLARLGGRTGYGVFAPDGTLYFARRSISAPPALMSWRPGLKAPKEMRYFPGSRPTLSPDGRSMAFGQMNWLGENNYNDLFVLSLKDKHVTRLTRGMRASDPTWSPDGSQIAFIRNDPPNYSLYRMSADGQNAAAVLQCAGPNQAFTPAWSPAGDRIAFSYYTPARGLRIYTVRPDGSNLVPLHEIAASGEEYDPAWSPDGRYLFFAADYTGVFNIYVFDFETARLRQVTNVLTGAYSPAVSPDGKTLAYTGYNAGGYDQYVMALDPSGWREPSVTAGTVDASRPVARNGYFSLELPPDIQEARPYSPWPTLSPTLNSLGGYYFSGDAFRVQAEFWGNDVLNTVEYFIGGLWTDGGPGYRADVRLNTGLLDFHLSSALDYDTDSFGSTIDRYWINGLGMGKDGRGLFSASDEWSLGVSAAHMGVRDLSGGPAGSFLLGNGTVHYGNRSSTMGPVDIARGWTIDYGFNGLYDLDALTFDYAQSADLQICVPFYNRAGFQLHAGIDQATDGSALFDFVVPGWGGASGDFAWEADASAEAQLFVVERGFIVCPLYLHGFNLYTGGHVGQVWGDDVQATLEFGLVSRTQFFRVPMDFYTVGVFSLTSPVNPWGFRWWVEIPL